MLTEQWDKLLRLRGLLSLYVVLHHARNIHWPRMHELNEGVSLFEKSICASINILGQWGLFAVLGFFVISGLSIGAAYPMLSHRRKFWVGRARRLYPALVFSVGLSALLFQLRGGRVAGQIGNLIATLSFQNNVIFGTAFAENFPYWSLACEGWYYLLYPFLGGLLFSRIKTLTFAVAVAIFPFLFYREGTGDLIGYFSIWLIGVLLSHFVERRMSLWKLVLALLVFMGGIIGFAIFDILNINFYPSSTMNLWVMMASMGIAGLIICLVQAQAKMPFRRMRKFLGNISYSLYLVHYPIMLFVASLKFWEKGMIGWLGASTVSIFLSLGVAFLSWMYFERPFMSKARSLDELKLQDA